MIDNTLTDSLILVTGAFWYYFVYSMVIPLFESLGWL